MRRTLALAAAVEALTGLCLLSLPAVLVKLLLGAELAAGSGEVMCRFAGIALIALGIACWPTRNCSVGSCPAAAMLTYNLVVAIGLAVLGVQGETVGALLWPAVAYHGVFAALLGPIRWTRRASTDSPTRM